MNTSFNKNRVLVADESHASLVSQLRYISYCHSKSFEVIDQNILKEYCDWSNTDECGLILLALNANNEAICTLRGNVYFSQEELEDKNPIFKNCESDFIQYPVLDMTIAATNPNYFNNGLLSVLRFYMYLLHRHSIKSIAGSVVKDSNTYHTLQRFGYSFIEINTYGEDVKPNSNWVIASLRSTKLDTALEYLRFKYREVIQSYPLIIL